MSTEACHPAWSIIAQASLVMEHTDSSCCLVGVGILPKMQT